MQKTKVIQLGRVRDLLGEWERVREGLISGELEGFSVTLFGNSGRQRIYLGGVCKEDPQEAAKAALRASMARMLTEDPPLAPKMNGTQ